ncbi:hypothetical protein [Aeromonas media]|uniref:Uncharacterized protein n=1 Tax=Aeromonas media TaxID=651 RepID=A0AAW5REA4_AERME|nr:hypothetical protein [Aeromonas media]MCV3287030.1 hypothetical protein [Aeromonas media]
MSGLIAKLAGSNNICCRIGASFALRMEVLTGALEQVYLLLTDTVSVRKLCWVCFPHRHIAVIATMGLIDGSAVTLFMN